MSVRLGAKSKTLAPESETPAPVISQRKIADTGQFRLQVDRQTKASFETYEAAQEAGFAIKKGYPILQVAIVDAKAGVSQLIELPKN
jgi:hypothetical protein